MRLPFASRKTWRRWLPAWIGLITWGPRREGAVVVGAYLRLWNKGWFVMDQRAADLADRVNSNDFVERLRKHHSVVERRGGLKVVARPLRDTSRWHRRKREDACRKTTGHCWHADGMVDWWCCICSADIEGMPPQQCIYCLDEPGERGGR